MKQKAEQKKKQIKNSGEKDVTLKSKRTKKEIQKVALDTRKKIHNAHTHPRIFDNEFLFVPY